MAAGQIIVPGAMPTRDRNGRATVGKLFFYEDGTQTPAPVYTTSALTTALANPVVSDAAGRFPSIWADDAELFTVVWTYDDEETIKTYSGVSAAEDAVLASVALAQAAADEAAADAVQTAADLAAILAIEQAGSTAPAIANKLDRDGSNVGVYAATLRTNIAALGTAAAAASTGASLVGFIQSGTGGAAETVQTALRRLPVTPEQYGAVANMAMLTDAAMTSGSATLTSASAPFVVGDVGKRVKVIGAGASGIPLAGTISAYVSATQVTLSVSASTTVSGKRAVYGTDDTAAIQNAMAASKKVRFNGKYLVNGALNPTTGHQLDFGPSAQLAQTASVTSASTPIFRAASVNNLSFSFEGGQLWGYGYFGGNPGGPWTGNTSSEDRPIELTNCENVILNRPYVLDGGTAGIYLKSCRKVTIMCPVVEGTHSLSSAIQFPYVSPGSEANFQNGIAFIHNSTYGPCDDIVVVAPDVSGVAQGILSEWENGAPPTIGIQILGGLIHDVPGQHGFYIQNGAVVVHGTKLRNIALSGIKTQLGGGAVTSIEGFCYTGIEGEYIGSQLFEVAVVGGEPGFIRYGKIEGRGTRCGRLLSVDTNVKDVTFDVAGEDISDVAVQLSGAGLSNLDIGVNAARMGGSGVRDYSNGATNVRFRDLRVKNINAPVTDTFTATSGQTTFPQITGATGVSSVTVAGSSAAFTKVGFNFVLTTPATAGQSVVASYTASNAAGNSGYRFSGSGSGTYEFLNFESLSSGYASLFMEQGTPTFIISGRAVMSGGSDYSARVISGTATLPGDTEAPQGYLGLANIRFTGTPQFAATSSGSTTVLRVSTPSQNGAFVVEITLIGNKTDDTQQKAVVLRRAFTYDGTTVLAVAATQETVVGVTGTFDGTYSLNAGTGGTTGANNWNVLVSNSGGSFDWKMQENVVYV